MRTRLESPRALKGYALLLLCGALAACASPAGSDGGHDTAVDTRADSVAEASAPDVGADARLDASPDAPRDGAVDSRVDAAIEASPDDVPESEFPGDVQPPDDAMDATPEAAPDSEVDAGADAPDAPVSDSAEAAAPDASEAGVDAGADAADASADADASDDADAGQDVVVADVPPPECITPADCPPTANECGTATCTSGRCGVSFASSGTPLSAQSPGDCQSRVCDGAGGIASAANNSDPFDDGNACTLDLCSSGVPSNPPAGAGASCASGGGSFCNGTGSCVQCLNALQCPGSDTMCGTRTCTAGSCGRNNVAAGTPMGSQAPGDCRENQCDGAGNLTSAVSNTDVPVDGNPCTADVCTVGAPSNPPAPAGASCGAGLLCDGAGSCGQCNAAADCPGSDTLCSARVCVGHVCGRGNTPSGTPVGAQMSGDCHLNQCDGSGNQVNGVDLTDLPADDGVQCTAEVCVAGVPAHPPSPLGTACNQGGGARCNGAGACVQCFAATDCPGSDTECRMRTCTAGVCGSANAPAGTVTSAQTPGDCRENQCDGAGSIAPVTRNTDVPIDGNQCTADVCAAGTPSNPPTLRGSACSISGVVCDGTGVCVQCNVNADCASGGRCTSGMCAAPSCTDGLRNGTESDIDCGGSCGPCLVGRHCGAATDCASGSCNAGGACEYTLAVLRLGDGMAALTSAATVAIVEYYTLAGTTLRASTTLPVAMSGANYPLTLSGTATAEGALSTSGDGRFLALAGYDAAPGLAGVSSSTAAAVPRVFGRVDRNGVADTSTLLTGSFSGSGVRGAATSDGVTVWAVGASSGVVTSTLGSILAPTAVSTTFTNLRTANIFGAQLYVSGSTGVLQGVATVGSGLPTTSGQTITELPGLPTTSGPSPYAFVLPGNDATGAAVLYVADDRTSALGGVQRWSLHSGTWTLDYTLSVGTGLGARGVTAFGSAGAFTVVATTTTGALVLLQDTGASSVATTLVAARTNTTLRGVTLAPYAP